MNEEAAAIILSTKWMGRSRSDRARGHLHEKSRHDSSPIEACGGPVASRSTVVEFSEARPMHSGAPPCFTERELGRRAPERPRCFRSHQPSFRGIRRLDFGGDRAPAGCARWSGFRARAGGKRTYIAVFFLARAPDDAGRESSREAKKSFRSLPRFALSRAGKV